MNTIETFVRHVATATVLPELGKPDHNRVSDLAKIAYANCAPSPSRSSNLPVGS